MKPKQNRGVALILVLLVLALGTLVLSASLRSNLDLIEQSSYISQSARARQLISALEASAVEQLLEYRLSNPSEQLPDPLQFETDIEDINLSFLDLQAKLNINSIPGCGQCIEALMQISGDKGITFHADTLLDWIDEDEFERDFGAESWRYQNGVSPYRAANQKATHASEMNLVDGVDPELWHAWKPYVVALPKPTPINVNTADAELLSALSPTIRAEQVELARQTRGGFQSITEFLSARETAGNQIDSNMLSVTTTFVALDTRVEIAGETFRQYRILELLGDTAASQGVSIP